MMIVLLIIIGILLMLKTDFFKNDKQLFEKYALNLVGVEKNSTEQKLKEYIEKRKNATYTVEGGIKTNIDLKEHPSKYKATNNSNIRFKGDVECPMGRGQELPASHGRGHGFSLGRGFSPGGL